MKNAFLIAGASVALALAGCSSTQSSGGMGNDYDTEAGSGISTKGAYNPNSAIENPRGSSAGWNKNQNGVGQAPAEPASPPEDE